jgi:arylsulfatase A-like enzyme
MAIAHIGVERAPAQMPIHLLHRTATCVLVGFAGFLAIGTAKQALSADKASVPNIVLILADDLGFSDLGCYGSEIATPNLDRLAKEGVQFAQFYNTAQCCPSRAALLTGLYPHQAGMGHMTEDYKRPGYRGDLNDRGVTLAELLGQRGYQTYMCGKWHLTKFTGPEGPKHNWPLNRGFDRFYGTLLGGGSYFDPPSLMRDDRIVKPEGEFYYTEAIGRRAGEYLEQASKSSRPFFLYVAFTAPHWPLHARPVDLDRYRGRYNGGWDDLREARYRRQIDRDLIRRTWPLTPRDPRVLAWYDVPQKEWHQRRMEVYAAQVDAMDQSVGVILEKLKQIGRENDTLVIFVSDNGGCGEEAAANWTGPHVPKTTRSGQAVQVGNDPGFLPGTEDTYQSYGVPWANVSNTPFRLYKHWVHEGGISTPCLMRWPEGIRKRGQLTQQVGHLIDIVPTCLAAARLRYPKEYKGQALLPLEGASLLPALEGQPIERGPIFWEHEGNRAVRDGKWKLVSKAPGKWELFDMEADRTEMNDLAAANPAEVERLSALYDQWAAQCNVLPWRSGN